jgi:thiol-disulfide isomerase/thioredoxin
VLAVALLMALGVDTELRTRVPEYTRALQSLETSAAASDEIDGLVGPRSGASAAGEELDDYGPAPEFAGIDGWLNSEPLTLESLRGKVVVLDFWTYSCINCLRTLPYLKRWDETYRDKGLVLVGVHSPEFAFERERSNVEDAVERLGLEYPIALDSDFDTWEAWDNRYWPAKYFVDREGRVRYAHFGEGDYEESERVIQELLAEPDPGAELVSDDVEAPRGAMDVGTPETYLGYGRIERFSGSPIRPDREASYAFPAYLPPNGLAYSGRWTVEGERIVAGEGARLRLDFRARSVNLVMGIDAEAGGVEVLVDGKFVRHVTVERDDIYALAAFEGPARERVLELRFRPGTQAYAFTFG